MFRLLMFISRAWRSYQIGREKHALVSYLLYYFKIRKTSGGGPNTVISIYGNDAATKVVYQIQFCNF